jgi:hypothetical protein
MDSAKTIATMALTKRAKDIENWGIGNEIICRVRHYYPIGWQICALNKQYLHDRVIVLNESFLSRHFDGIKGIY